MHDSLLMVGCGNMSGAMLEGWLAADRLPAHVTVVDPVRDAAPGGLPVLREIPGDLPGDGAFDTVLLGFKPQNLAEAAPALAPLVGANTVVLSLLAGVELAVLRRHFPDAKAVVRVMPNLAVSLGKAPVALAADHADPALRDSITALMAPLGSPEWLGEDKFDIVTALAGSGPAFVYRFIDALGAAAGGEARWGPYPVAIGGVRRRLSCRASEPENRCHFSWKRSSRHQLDCPSAVHS